MSELAVVEPGLQGSSGDASGANGAQAGDGAENALPPVGWGGGEAGPAGPEALLSEGEEPPAPADRLRDLQGQSDRLRDQLAQRDQEVLSLRSSLQEAAMKYRQALLDAYPAVPQELLSGATVEELEASLERARAAVERIRQKLEEDMARSLSVPAGAPVRRAPDLSALSAREKIVYGLASR